jgi:hypothetical protein
VGDTESQGRDNKGNFIPYKRQLVTGWIKAQTKKMRTCTSTRDGSGKNTHSDSNCQGVDSGIRLDHL